MADEALLSAAFWTGSGWEAACFFTPLACADIAGTH